MVHMTDEHVDQSPRADGVFAGCANPKRGLIRHVADEEDVGAALMLKFLNQILKGLGVESRLAHKIILLKTRQRSRISATNSKKPICEDPLHIIEMPHHLFDRPFLRRIAEESLLVG